MLSFSYICFLNIYSVVYCHFNLLFVALPKYVIVSSSRSAFNFHILYLEKVQMFVFVYRIHAYEMKFSIIKLSKKNCEKKEENYYMIILIYTFFVQESTFPINIWTYLSFLEVKCLNRVCK